MDIGKRDKERESQDPVTTPSWRFPRVVVMTNAFWDNVGWSKGVYGIEV